MKKSLLLLVAGAITLSAGAQTARVTPTGTAALGAGKLITKKTTLSASNKAVARSHSGDRTTLTCAITADFSGGTYTTLPAGWTAGITSGPGTWHWANMASHAGISLPALASSTASNGWMIFDSDSLGGGSSGTATPGGWLQSPSYDCSALGTVVLSFQEEYAKFNDSTRVWVSSNGGSTWTIYPISVNEDLFDFQITNNPQTVHVDISAAAANKPAVIIRFVYGSAAQGGSYSWSIDDICISPKDLHDVGVEKSWVYEPHCTSTTGAYDGSIFATPLAFVDSIYPVTRISNYGSSTEAAVTLTSSIYKLSTHGPILYTSSDTYMNLTGYATLPANSADSFVSFGGYLPVDTGVYIVANSATLAGDADMSNNADSIAFQVTDTTFAVNYGTIDYNGGYYVYNSAANKAFFQGARFDIPCGATADTVSGFSVAFSSSSVAGSGTITVQLYSIDKAASMWTYLGSSMSRNATAANFSTSGSIHWVDFRINQTSTSASPDVTPFILQPGNSYAAVVQGNGLNHDLVIAYSNPAPATGYAPGYFGQSDQSSNDGDHTFGSTAATGITNATPAVRMFTGPVRVWPSAVTNINNEGSIGDAYPNPTSTTVTVPFTMTVDTKVAVTLSDITGQVISSQNINAVGGQAATATFNTANLGAGVYMYTVNANGSSKTGRVVVAH